MALLSLLKDRMAREPSPQLLAIPFAPKHANKTSIAGPPWSSSSFHLLSNPLCPFLAWGPYLTPAQGHSEQCLYEE